MSVTMNVHRVAEVRAQYRTVSRSKWVSLELLDKDGECLLDLTVFGDGDGEGFLRAVADKLNEAADLAKKRHAEMVGEEA